MDLGLIFSIAGSGLEAQRIRMDVIASNLANAQTTRTPEGGPYRRRDVLFVAMPAGPSPFQSALEAALQKVQVSQVVEDPRPFPEVYRPGHPDADERGYVRLPNVNVLEEMVNLMAAARAYEANVTVLNTTKAMALQALEIGR